jgi:prepilin-type processing-associated H-X9-DG protein
VRVPSSGAATRAHFRSNNELYSFHPGGVNVLFCDGSVHFLKESMDPRIVVYLITRAGGEITSSAQY